MSLLDSAKDAAWRASVKLRRPKVTWREMINSIVFDAVGNEIYQESWDLLVILDACRPDVLRSVSDEYDFITDVPTTFSKGSSSQQWISENFKSEYLTETKRTAYITGNPFSDDYLSESDFKLLDEVWRYEWDETVGTIPPDVLTDRTIYYGRKMDPERMIVHYMQPHFPSIPDPDLGSAVDPETNVWRNSVWNRLEQGTVSRERVWESYRENLRHVLDSVSTLLKNIDSETVVLTADHGNGFGEAGIYGHPRLRTHRVLREVPWVTTQARDNETYDPKFSGENYPEKDVEDRLADLGYR